jgi:DNA-binding NarL/FixJ family response regulator
MTTPIRIVVADDHPVVRDGLVAILSTRRDIEVVGEAGSGPDTVRAVAELRPDVLLLDLEMPEMDGVAVLHRLHELGSDVRVIVFTAFDTDERILAAVRAGAQGYLLKGVPRNEIFEAIHVVHAGNSLLQPVVASRLLRQMSEEDAATAGIRSLTARAPSSSTSARY